MSVYHMDPKNTNKRKHSGRLATWVKLDSKLFAEKLHLKQLHF